MYYVIKVQNHIRVPPKYFDLKVKDAIIKQIKTAYAGISDKDIGFVIDVVDVDEIGEGVIITGDGAIYYNCTFRLLTFKPELQEVVMGKVHDITNFGAFLNIGPVDGMIHISQTMDDHVSFSKDKVLIGRDTKKTLKPNDICRARIIAVSYKDPSNPKIGLTMRQPFLGKLEWIEEQRKGKTTSVKASKTPRQSKEKKQTKRK